MTFLMTGATEQMQQLRIELLRWYHEAGVDLALDEMPHDRFAEGRAERQTLEADNTAQASMKREVQSGSPPPPEKRSPVKMPAPMMGPGEALLSARQLAASAKTLDELRDILTQFEGCGLRSTATRLVFGDGKAGARLMLVGEAPGREEDLQGTPFIGPAGQLLNKILAAIGLARSEVYIANVVPWRPPGNRTPTLQETTICKPFIERQIELVRPQILVCLGGPSAQTLLQQKAGILSLRGRWFDYPIGNLLSGNLNLKAMPTLHPAYLLRQPTQKRLAWSDFVAIKKLIDRNN